MFISLYVMLHVAAESKAFVQHLLQTQKGY